MYNATDYVNEYGNLPFSSLPFNTADCVSLCGILYVPVERAVTSEFEKEPRLTFGEAIAKLHAMNGYKHVAYGIFMDKSLSRRFVDMANYKRFADMKITGCVSIYDAVDVVQFAASTLIMPDGTLFICFRGTDDTLTGWREDIDVLVKGSIPSYKHALAYIEKAAETYDGDIILGGHSKGGNVALYTALNCSEKVKKRLKRVYNNEGQGFADYTPFETKEYRELLPKYTHIVPSSSFVGMLLAHDQDYTVIKSSKHLGPMQHDPGTWQFRGCEPDTLSELTRLGRITDSVLEKIMLEYPRDNYDAMYNSFCNIVAAAGEKTLLRLIKNIGPASVKMAAAAKKLDGEQREKWRDLTAFIKMAIKESRRNEDGAMPKKGLTKILGR